jgi:hypothetical protein
MNLFQWITIPVLVVLFLLELRRVLFLAPRFQLDRTLRALVWAGAALAIYDPDLTSILANAVGIQRGADLVVYVFILVAVAVAFYLYSSNVRLERQLTEVVRHLAIRNAEGPNASLGETRR